MKIVPVLQDKVDEKLAKFNRYFGDEATATVKFTHEKDMVKAEITMHIHNRYYRSETSAEDAADALDLAVDVMEGQLRKHKTRIDKKIRDNAHMKEFIRSNLGDFEEEETVSGITRTKKFDLSPMDPEEATLQMEMLGHSFLLFLNMESEKVNLVYKRKDGNYGLIEPEY